MSRLGYSEKPSITKECKTQKFSPISSDRFQGHGQKTIFSARVKFFLVFIRKELKPIISSYFNALWIFDFHFSREIWFKISDLAAYHCGYSWSDFLVRRSNEVNLLHVVYVYMYIARVHENDIYKLWFRQIESHSTVSKSWVG